MLLNACQFHHLPLSWAFWGVEASPPKKVCRYLVPEPARFEACKIENIDALPKPIWPKPKKDQNQLNLLNLPSQIRWCDQIPRWVDNHSGLMHMFFRNGLKQQLALTMAVQLVILIYRHLHIHWLHCTVHDVNGNPYQEKGKANRSIIQSGTIFEQTCIESAKYYGRFLCSLIFLALRLWGFWHVELLGSNFAWFRPIQTHQRPGPVRGHRPFFGWHLEGLWATERLSVFL